MKYEGGTVRRVLTNILIHKIGLEEEEVRLDSTFRDLAVDSLDFVEVVMELEGHYDTSFPDEQLIEVEDGNIEEFIKKIETLMQIDHEKE